MTCVTMPRFASAPRLAIVPTNNGSRVPLPSVESLPGGVSVSQRLEAEVPGSSRNDYRQYGAGPGDAAAPSHAYRAGGGLSQW